MKLMGSHPSNQWRVDGRTADLSRAVRKPVRPVALAAEPQSLIGDANRSALVVVDMQNDVCCKGGYLDYRGRDIFGREPVPRARHRRRTVSQRRGVRRALWCWLSPERGSLVPVVVPHGWNSG